MASTDTDSPMAAHPHPRIDRPLFIPRLGYQQQSLTPLIQSLGVRLVAAPLYYTQTNRELALVPIQRELALALDPGTHLRQLPADQRAPSFNALSFGRDTDAFDPDRDSVDDALLERLVIDALDLQRGRGATLMLTSFHLSGRPGTRGRDLDLLLARAGVAHFRRERMDEPPDYAACPIAREIYATLAVAIETLRSPYDRRRLADAYLDIASDGYWVKVFGLDETASHEDIRAAGAFLADLRADARPVVACGAGQLYLGMLASGVSASIGIAGASVHGFRPTGRRPRGTDSAGAAPGAPTTSSTCAPSASAPTRPGRRSPTRPATAVATLSTSRHPAPESTTTPRPCAARRPPMPSTAASRNAANGCLDSPPSPPGQLTTPA